MALHQHMARVAAGAKTGKSEGAKTPPTPKAKKKNLKLR